MPIPSDDAIGPLRCVPRSKPVCGRRPNFSPNSQGRRRSPSDEKSAGQNRIVAATKPDVKEGEELVMERVRILKRGENLSPNLSPSLSEGSRSVTLEEEDVIFCSTDRLRSNPEVVREQISFREKTRTVEDWAWFVLTPPPPSSVPIPLWIVKKKPDAAFVALDLGRLLGLDLL